MVDFAIFLGGEPYHDNRARRTRTRMGRTVGAEPVCGKPVRNARGAREHRDDKGDREREENAGDWRPVNPPLTKSGSQGAVYWPRDTG